MSGRSTRSGARRALWRASLVLAGLLALALLQRPLLVVLPVLVVLAVRAARAARPRVFGACAALLAIAWLVEAAAAVRFYRAGSARFQLEEGSSARWAFRLDPVLGSVPSPDVRLRDVRRQGAVAYDVRYTIDGRGWRSAPPVAPASAPAVVVFGDSTAFGIGLEDRDTIAAKVEALSAGRLAGLSLGLPDGGPNHLHAILENGLEAAPLAGRKVALGVYVGSGDARPLAGLVPTRAGPAYRLGKDGQIVPVGIRRGRARRSPRTWLAGRSALLSWLRPRNPRIPPQAIALESALFIEARRVFEERHHAPLLLVLADDVDERLLRRLGSTADSVVLRPELSRRARLARPLAEDAEGLASLLVARASR